MYSTLSRCLRITRFERWTTYWRRRISVTYRRVFTRRSTRIPSRIFGSGSTPIRPCHEAPSPQLYRVVKEWKLMRPNGLMLIQLPRAGWSAHCAVRRRKRCPTSLKIRSLSSQAVPKGLGWLRQSYSPRRGICLYHGPSPEGTRRGREGNRHQRCGTWDVLQDEATKDESQSGSPVFGAMFPA